MSGDSSQPQPGENDPNAAARQKFILKWVIAACILGNVLVLLWAFSGKHGK